MLLLACGNWEKLQAMVSLFAGHWAYWCGPPCSRRKKPAEHFLHLWSLLSAVHKCVAAESNLLPLQKTTLLGRKCFLVLKSRGSTRLRV